MVRIVVPLQDQWRVPESPDRPGEQHMAGQAQTTGVVEQESAPAELLPEHEGKIHRERGHDGTAEDECIDPRTWQGK